MKKFAIVFSVENKGQGPFVDFEKMAVVLATSIRNCMPSVDSYCGVFTQRYISPSVENHLARLNVNLIYDNLFNSNTRPVDLFLRSFTKHYFANKLLDQYEYLVYIDVDALFLKPLEFDFDPTGPIALVDEMPDWVKNFENTYTNTGDSSRLYYNWIDIINQHNRYIFDLNYHDKTTVFEKNTDVIISKRINDSGLQKIQQTVGAYHCLHPLTLESQVMHYDDFTASGSLINLQLVRPDIYMQYSMLIEHVLGQKITNQVGFWEERMQQYS